MCVTRVPLYRVVRQLSLPRAVVSCITFYVSSRYSTYGYLYYVTVGKPTFTKMLSSPHILRRVSVGKVHEITIFPSTDAIVMCRARLDSATLRTASASFAHIHGSLLCLILLHFVRNVYLFIPSYPYFVTVIPYLVCFPQHLYSNCSITW